MYIPVYTKLSPAVYLLTCLCLLAGARAKSQYNVRGKHCDVLNNDGDAGQQEAGQEKDQPLGEDSENEELTSTWGGRT